MSSLYHQRLQNAVAVYKSQVNRIVGDLMRNLITDIVFIVVIPVGLSLAALKWSGVVGFATTLGLGGINANERMMRGNAMLKIFWGESSKLRRTVETLELELSLCDPSDTNRLQDVEKKLREYLAVLP